jgi:hypothetical protein
MTDPPSADAEIHSMKFAKVVSVYKSVSVLGALLWLGLGAAPAAHAQAFHLVNAGSYPVPGPAVSVAIGDFNGDGHPDLVVALELS